MKKQCTICKGCGLVKKKEIKPKCVKDHGTNYFCIKCEYSSKYGLYEECDNCYGSGRIKE